MIFSPDFEEIGFVEKTHGIDGFLRINHYKNSIANLLAMEFLFLEQKGQKVPYRIKQWKKESSLILFDGLTKPELAQAVVGSAIYAIAKGKPKVKNVSTIIGFKLIDTAINFESTVIRINDIPNNPLIEVEINQQNTYLPFNEDFISKIDWNKKIIYYTLPNGILNL